MVFEALHSYFVDPILSNGWFNPINTLTYSIILIVAVFLVFRMLRKMGIKIDKNFFYAIVPFVFWATSTRVLHDAAVAGVLSPELNAFYGMIIFPTPGSYIITFIFAFCSLIVGMILQKFAKIAYWKVMVVIGVVATLLNFILLPFSNPAAAGLIVGLTLLSMGIYVGIGKIILTKLKEVHITTHIKSIFSYENTGILAAHLLDASATFVSIAYFGYFEQHFLPRSLFPFFGPGIMFVLKFIVVIPALWLIDRYAEDPQFKTLLKIVVLILGLAPGMRDTIRLAAMV